MQKLAKAMRKAGISHYKTSKIEISLFEAAPKRAARASAPSEPAKPLTPQQQHEQQMRRLMWSAPGFQMDEGKVG